eukprot:scaffold18785_cov33-Prasinocladus_malaysianus.AAC.1
MLVIDNKGIGVAKPLNEFKSHMSKQRDEFRKQIEEVFRQDARLHISSRDVDVIMTATNPTVETLGLNSNGAAGKASNKIKQQVVRK